MKKFNIVGFILTLFILLIMQSISSQTNYYDIIDKKVKAIEQKVINWRHDFHQNPELGNREFRTAEIITKHLQSLGMEVKTKVGVTGVVGILKGDKPGPVIALRADMDALPVTFNNVSLTSLMIPSLIKTVGSENVKLITPETGAEDFSYFAQEVPGLYFFIGGCAKGNDVNNVAPHHTSEFIIDDSSLKTGVSVFCNLVFDYPKLHKKY